ncbi:MAG: hypothetical protein ACXADY_21870 [Candidatus Hodarchaeales archaeon]|jgi:hypothetical protein
MNAVQLLLPEDKKPKKIVILKEVCTENTESTTSFKIKEPIMEIPINQILKTVLELMNKMPVEEEVSWRTMNHLGKNYMRLNAKS